MTLRHLRAYLPPALGCLLAGCVTGGMRGAPRTIDYTCDGGARIVATYFNAGRHDTPFVVLDWNGHEHGLALAPSASGARYASLDGPTPAGPGLEWWEAKGEARLSAFTGEDFWTTRALLSHCRPPR